MPLILYWFPPCYMFQVYLFFYCINIKILTRCRYRSLRIYVNGQSVCLGFFVPIEIFSLIRRRHHYRWRAITVYWYSSLLAIEQWGFFNVSHLLWHGTSVYDSHLRRSMSLTLVVERLAVELSLPVWTI